ncbi:hypothetical protein [Flagellimonas eckloniae]|uniref:Uncharacterized protein n=1 Tax=Flagellimonas eckloniae TaxID=346185 RepID=A0A0N8WGF3_9FLAO|nr:hypothetical protein [Allomuricauda eckloniae]KQC31339.1 hypothetical protein AAY42_16690 [Allomuricauda eckloniae]
MKQKILFSLDADELLELRELLQKSNLAGMQELVDLVVDKGNPDDYIKRKVFEALSDLSGFDIEDINESQNLKLDLGLSLYHKRSLKSYFQKIVKDLKSDKVVKVKECERLGTVKDCIVLVKSKV